MRLNAKNAQSWMLVACFALLGCGAGNSRFDSRAPQVSKPSADEAPAQRDVADDRAQRAEHHGRG